jgi:hypothetical protein
MAHCWTDAVDLRGEKLMSYDPGAFVSCHDEQ